MDIICFESIKINEPVIRGKEAESLISIRKYDGSEMEFRLIFSYSEKANERHLPVIRLAMAMPLMNYGLFTRKIILDFEVSQADISLLEHLNGVFARDILVNKLARRRTDYLLEEFLEGLDDLSIDNIPVFATIIPKEVVPDSALGTIRTESCGVLSSGGKESLLTYGMLKELGADVHPLYVNESGGHWRTALPAYRYHKAREPNTGRVWTNVDRLYTFMLDNMKIIRPDHRRVVADTYPIRLCIFPVYVMALMPLFLDRGIGHLLIGSEFDDQRSVPEFNGIRHYYGVYDQTIDFDREMESWYASRIPGMRQWSAVRPVSGLIVERILVKRYPELASTQRSCHSCHFEGDEIVPCGKCTKCLGVLLFLKANCSDPGAMRFNPRSQEQLAQNLQRTPLRLDPDEYGHSLHLAGMDGTVHEHAESVHIDPNTDPELIPGHFRKGLMKIIGEHTNGMTKLEGGQWVKIS